MKRSISIFLIFIILISGAHPVFAIHFCDRHLSSIDLKTNDKEKCYCLIIKKESENRITNSLLHSCCIFTGSLITEKNCCTSNIVNLSTDNYNCETRTSDLRDLHSRASHVAVAFFYFSFNIKQESPLAAQSVFSASGLSRLNLDLLSYICTYRI